MKRTILHASLLLGTLAAGFYLWTVVAAVSEAFDDYYWTSHGVAAPSHPVLMAFKWPVIVGPMILLILVRALRQSEPGRD